MRAAYRVDHIRAAEERLIGRDGDEAVMRRAATGLAVVCARLVAATRGRVTGARVVLLVGSGNNGGDVLWAGAWLAGRGARVVAVPLATSVHGAGRTALLAAGGRLLDTGDTSGAEREIRSADLVVDGIVGIGGTGALRPTAAGVAAAALRSGALVVACDLPSGVDADSGAVADPDAVVRADVTVTFGALKPGLLLMPGAEFVGITHLVDIGLGADLLGVGPPATRVLQADDVALLLGSPGGDDHKYSRGVVVVSAGSDDYPGAGVLVAGGARCGGAGLVQFCGLRTGEVLSRFPDVVAGESAMPRATGAVVGPGLSGTARDAMESQPLDLLESDLPLVLDATALRWAAESNAWAEVVRRRAARGAVTVMTPHDGEFLALGGSADLLRRDRLAAALELATSWGSVVLLKGATTVVASPTGHSWVNPVAPPDLATAGSGDVLAGLVGSWLAAAEARLASDGRRLSLDAAAEVAAAAVWVHALAARLAVGDSRQPLAALELMEALPAAVGVARSGEYPGGRH